MSEPVLIAHTRNLLLQRPRSLTYEQIARDTDLNVRWIAALAQCADKDADFGAHKIERLYTYLSGKQLEL